MNVLLISLRGMLAGCATAVLGYAAMCGLYLAASTAAVNRQALTGRVAAVVMVSIVVLVWSIDTTRRTSARFKWPTWSTMSLITAVALFVSYLYPVFSLNSYEDEKRLLRRAADAINASKGSSDLPLPRGYVVQIEQRPLSARSVRLNVHLSNRVVAKVIGIDLIKADNVAVEMRDGRIERAWVDYF